MLKLRQVAMPVRTLTKGNASEFAMRIMGNYQIMAVRLPPRQMFHIILTGGEEGRDMPGDLSVRNSVNISQQAYLDIVNQIVNRVKSFVSGKAVYQDRVFVETALRSMGIRSAADFVQTAVHTAGIGQKKWKISQLLGKPEEAAAQVRAYLRRGSTRLSKLREKMGGRGTSTGKHRTLYLWDQVPSRLGLAEICRRLREIYAFREGGARPGRETAVLAEVSGYGDSLLARRINREGFGIQAAEIWSVWNPYEWIRNKTAGTTPGQIWEELAAATLLAGIQETALYEVMSGRRARAWLNVEDMLAGTARMTAERFFFYHRAFRAADMENQRALMETVENGFSREIRILGKIRERAEAADHEKDAGEIKKLRFLITRLVREQQKDFREGLEEQSRGMLRTALRIEEEVRRYILYEDMRHITWQAGRVWDRVKIVHIREGVKGPANPSGDGSGGSNQNYMNASMGLRDASHSERETVRAKLSGLSQKETGRLIKETMQEQMNVLTDKVYGRLEKRLLDEKRRRGM